MADGGAETLPGEVDNLSGDAFTRQEPPGCPVGEVVAVVVEQVLLELGPLLRVRQAVRAEFILRLLGRPQLHGPEWPPERRRHRRVCTDPRSILPFRTLNNNRRVLDSFYFKS